MFISLAKSQLCHGPAPHWWSLLHIAFAVVLFGISLCNINGIRTLHYIPATDAQCVSLVKPLAGAALALNALALIVACRWLNVRIPHCSEPPLVRPAAPVSYTHLTLPTKRIV